jgi:hypothetical protein
MSHPNTWKAALDIIQGTQTSKGADYAQDSDPWSAFRSVADHFGMPLYEAGLFNMLQKIERLKSLRMNGREPHNESVYDTYMDLAVYGVLTFAMYLDQMSPVNSSDTKSSDIGQHKTVDQNTFQSVPLRTEDARLLALLCDAAIDGRWDSALWNDVQVITNLKAYRSRFLKILEGQ